MPREKKSVKFDFGTLPISLRQAVQDYLWHLEFISHDGKRTSVQVSDLAIEYTVESDETKPAAGHDPGPIGC